MGSYLASRAVASSKPSPFETPSTVELSVPCLPTCLTASIPLLILVLLSLCSCGPMYRTYHSYVPPESENGMMCINGCLGIRQQCQSQEQTNYQLCENQESMLLNLCRSQKRYGYDKKGRYVCVGHCLCIPSHCPEPDLSKCEDLYNQCFSNCGGEVHSYTVCVQNCEGVDSEQTPAGTP